MLCGPKVGRCELLAPVGMRGWGGGELETSYSGGWYLSLGVVLAASSPATQIPPLKEMRLLLALDRERTKRRYTIEMGRG